MIHNGGSYALPSRCDVGDELMSNALYMVVEHFKNGDAVAVYRRFREKGSMAPKGLRYVSSWADEAYKRCCQLMETDDR
jgi:hypothetical protein